MRVSKWSGTGRRSTGREGKKLAHLEHRARDVADAERADLDGRDLEPDRPPEALELALERLWHAQRLAGPDVVLAAGVDDQLEVCVLLGELFRAFRADGAGRGRAAGGAVVSGRGDRSAGEEQEEDADGVRREGRLEQERQRRQELGHEVGDLGREERQDAVVRRRARLLGREPAALLEAARRQGEGRGALFE